MIDLQSWENSVLGQQLNSDGVKADKGQCSQVPIAWAMANHPGVNWGELLVPLGSNAGIKAWAGKSTPYYTWIDNNHADVNQLPLPGDIMVFGATPAQGYTNQYKNDFGHTGVCKSASPSGYTLIQQNSPSLGSGVNDTSYPWNYRPCLGWFRDVNNFVHAPIPTPPAPIMSTNVGRILTLPVLNADGTPDDVWHVYNVDGPYDVAHATHVLNPYMYRGESPQGLQYEILQDLGNGIFVIQTQMFGRVAIWTHNTNATIS